MEAEGSLPWIQQFTNYLSFEKVIPMEPDLRSPVIFFNSRGFSMRSFQLLARTPRWKTVPCRLFATAYSVYLFSGILNGCFLHPSNEVTPVLRSKKRLPLKICCVYRSLICYIQDSDYQQNMPYMYKFQIFVPYLYLLLLTLRRPFIQDVSYIQTKGYIPRTIRPFAVSMEHKGRPE